MSDLTAPKSRALPWKVRPLLAAAGRLGRWVARLPDGQDDLAPEPPAERRRWTAADGLALVSLTGLLAVLFRAYLLGEALFIGNSDRLNTYLNLLKFHTEHIRAGKFVAWNENMFGGFNTLGIVYNFPNPLTYLLSQVSPERLFFAASLVSFVLLATAGWAAYAFLRTLCRHRWYAFVGAALYELTWVVVFNAAQNDMSFVVHIVVPLGLLALRRVRPDRARGSFLAVAVLLWVLLFFTFLQIAAYAILLLGAYALHRSRQVRSWAPTLAFGLGLVVAVVGAWPRIYTIRQEMELVIRNKPGFPPDTFLYDGPREIFRFFSDAFFGRNQAQVLETYNTVNTSEGMLLYLSSFAALFLVWGAVRYRGERFRLFRFRDGDASFFLWIVAACLAIVTIRPVAYIFFLAFLQTNFHHSRVVIVAALPAAALVALMLEGLAGEGESPPLSLRARLFRWGASPAAALAVVGLIHEAAAAGNPEHRIILDQPLYRLGYSLAKGLVYLTPRNCYEPSDFSFWHGWFHDSYLHPYALRQIFWSLVAFLLFLRLLARWPGGRPHLAGALAVAMIGQLFVSDNFQVNANLERRPDDGPVTNNNDIQVAPVTYFRPPSPAATAVWAERLESGCYRTVLISSLAYPTQCPPHLSGFWGLRLIEGYSTSTPVRLFAMPIPYGILAVQCISYHNLRELDWQLMALLNVKYAAVVDDAFYCNAARTPDGGWREARPEDVTIVENPYPVLPRAFFARRVQPVADLSEGLVAMFGEGIYEHKRWAFQHRDEAEIDRLEQAMDVDGRWKRIQHADVAEKSYVEGWPGLDIAGDDRLIDATFQGDRIEVCVAPSDRWRFMVLNELYHPCWRAQADGRDLPIYPTNIFMRGVAVPPGVSEVVFTFQPFVTSRWALAWYGSALIGLVAAFVWIRRRDRALHGTLVK